MRKYDDFSKAAIEIRRELIRLHAYTKWKDNIRRAYFVDKSVGFFDLLDLILTKIKIYSTSNEYYYVNGESYTIVRSWLLSIFFSASAGFAWLDTKEGSNYWNDILIKIRDKFCKK